MKKQFILVVFFSFIILGYCFVNITFAKVGDPIIGVPIGLEGDPNITGEPIDGVDVKLGHNNGGSLMASSDLGISDVGTLPTSFFYFFKQWGRGIDRLFTWRAESRVKLELSITNQTAAELLEVNKAYDACAANALGGGKSCKPDDVKNALQNYTKAQDRLNTRIAGLSDKSSNPNTVSLLKEVDDKTSKQIALLAQLDINTNLDSVGTRSEGLVELVGDVAVKAKDNLEKILISTVEKGNDSPSLKQKSEEQIKRAGVAIDEANSAMGQVSTTKGINVNPGGVDVRGSGKVVETIDEQSSIFDRWGNMITNAKSHLEEAKTAFADGKYGEAYGQARSAEAMVAVLATGQNFPDDKKVDIIIPPTPPAETKTKLNTNTNKEPEKVLENNSPLPTERKPIEQKDEPTTLTSDSTSLPGTAPTPAGGSAGNLRENSIGL